MTTDTGRQSHPQAVTQWWPFRPRYLRLMSAYRSYSTGRCAPVALIRSDDGTLRMARVDTPPAHPDGDWLVRPYRTPGAATPVRTRDMVEIDCARAVAGYSC